MQNNKTLFPTLLSLRSKAIDLCPIKKTLGTSDEYRRDETLVDCRLSLPSSDILLKHLSSQMNKQVVSSVSGEDRISALPNDIICNILSYLHVDESARTSILSKRWRNMWLLSPISISDESIVKQSLIYCFTQVESSFWIVNAISHIISTHPGPIHTCHFSLPDWGEYHETLVNTLKTLTLKGIQNLRINLKYFKIPCFVFECDSLVDVHLWGGSLPDHLPAHAGTFRNLRKLKFMYCFIKVEFLVNLLSSSPIIELALFGCHLLGDFVIESGSLRKFHTKDNSERSVFHLTVKDAPNLESFKCEDLPRCCKVLILNAPKLKVLSRIDMETSILQLGNYQFDHYDEYLKIIGEITYMPSLRSLDIVVDFGRPDESNFAMHLLMCFPNLETLEVCMKGEFCTYYEYYGNLNSVVSANNAAATVVDGDHDDHACLISNINCLDRHLKNVRLTNYYGGRAHMDFARLIVANAKVLETLTIVYGNPLEERWTKALKHFLMQNRASNMLRIEFIKSVD